MPEQGKSGEPSVELVDQQFWRFRVASEYAVGASLGTEFPRPLPMSAGSDASSRLKVSELN